MPFPCCIGKMPEAKNKEQTNNKRVFYKPINLHEGYDNGLELLVYKNEQIHQLPHTHMSSSVPRYSPVIKDHLNISTNTLSFLETRVSNVINTPCGPAISQASSNVIVSNCNSPSMLITNLIFPEETGQQIREQHISDVNNESKLLNTCQPSNDKYEPNSHTNCKYELHTHGKVDHVCQLNDEDSTEAKSNKFLDESTLNISTNQYKDPKEHHHKSYDLISTNQEIPTADNKNQSICNDAIKNIDKYIKPIDKIQIHTKDSNIFEKSKYEKNDCNSMFNQINENNRKEKSKKSKKTIHIEIQFSPKNNIYVDGKQKHTNINKNKQENKPKQRMGSINNKEPNITSLDKNIHQILAESTTSREGIPNNSVGIDNKCDQVLDNRKSVKNADLHESEASNNKLVIHENDDIGHVTGNELESNTEFDQLFVPKADREITDDTNLKFSIENLIPFIDEPECKIGKLVRCERNSVESSIEADETINNEPPEALRLSQGRLQMLNGSLPVVESDPQMAQLFASAQLRIEEITNEKITSNKSVSNLEDDPIADIREFLNSSLNEKNSIPWATVKAVLDVYEPQISFAKRELDKWKNVTTTDETMENIEYYTELINELQEKVDLAQQAMKLLLSRNDPAEVKSMLEVEERSLDEIKGNMKIESNELKLLEEKYLNGDISLREKIRSSRIKIQQFESEIKNKLADIHRLNEIVHEYEGKF